MINKIKKFINDNQFNIDNKIICAVSGGVDSVVLVYALKSLGYDVILAHVNHNVRKESKMEEEEMKQYANKLQIPFELLDYHFDGNGNFENEARIARYNFFYELCLKYHTNIIATAHHLDDQLETVIMKIMNGSNLYGYGGIALQYDNSKYRVIRPLLCVNKEELYKFANDNNLKYFEDKSNESDLYLRNRIRHNIVPLLKNECNDIYDKISKYSIMTHEAFDFIRRLSIEYLDKNNGIDISSFNMLDIALRKDIVSLLLEKYNINRNNNIIIDIIKFLEKNEGNKYLILSDDYRLYREYNKAFIFKDDISKPNPLKLNINEEIIYDRYKIYFSKNIPPSNAKYIKLCYNDVKLPLWVRPRVDGDFISIENGIKKVSRVFIDNKVPLKLRDFVPIITDIDNNVLWIYNYLKSNEVYKMKQKGDIFLVVEELLYDK